MSFKFNPLSGEFDFFEAAGVPRLTDKRICGETISALKLITAQDNTNVLLSDNDLYVNAKVLGISLTAGNIGDEIDVLLFGKHEDAAFNFTLNEPLFLSANGVITETPPSTNFSTTIGHSLGAGAIFINIKEPIQL